MKKKRQRKKTSRPSTRSSSTQPPTGRVIRSSDDLLAQTRQVSSVAGRKGTQSRPTQTKKQPTSTKKSKKKKVSRRFKRRCRLLFQSSVFLGVMLTLLVVSYDFVEGYFDERLKHQVLMSEQIIPIQDLQLELNDSVTFKFFIESEESEASSQLIKVDFPHEFIKIKKRSSVPYPYLKANCSSDNRYCKLEEASDFTLYLKEEDIQGIQLP